MPSRKSSTAFASASSTLLSANPTWMRIQSPGAGGSSASRPTLTDRRTPLTETLARSGRSSEISMTSPGMARHMLLTASCGLRGRDHLGVAGKRGDGQLPQCVVDGGLRLLDAVHRRRRDDEQVVDAVQLGHL